MPVFHDKTMWKAVHMYALGRTAHYTKSPTHDPVESKEPLLDAIKNIKSQELKELLSTKTKYAKGAFKVGKTFDEMKLQKIINGHQTEGRLPQINRMNTI